HGPQHGPLVCVMCWTFGGSDTQVEDRAED
ncbi:hypothetical protein A2U01_0064845, partial [Trifolium medium]|nr:hypothetical protein [Trifolium medium]